MPDKVKDKTSKTGEMPRVEVEPRLRYEPLLPLLGDDDTSHLGSSTGVMRIVPENHDDGTEHDVDQPTQ